MTRIKEQIYNNPFDGIDNSLFAYPPLLSLITNAVPIADPITNTNRETEIVSTDIQCILYPHFIFPIIEKIVLRINVRIIIHAGFNSLLLFK